MRLNRVFVDDELAENKLVSLPSDVVRHLITVLKMKEGESLIVFNGDGFSYHATIDSINKREVKVSIDRQESSNNESPLKLHLYQAVARGDKMDFTIQKSVELGVTEITPIFTERCGVKLSTDRLEKKLNHWQKVIISACEQCGRNQLPKLNRPKSLPELVGDSEVDEFMLILNPHSGKRIAELERSTHFSLVIGPEGGLTDDEVSAFEKNGCSSVKLGPRILRTETAGLAVIAIMQSIFGDV
ncbi:16S rRNA (uracil(1498)-N(3))-methyltransferase [Pleionea sediminis]|uniref:16S rRNA (uracil(1498)-N(3))-methyltransferase n=1 Tax=Pleionea sediminis TaxID=2569479 RepID=UPI0013DDA901|nr:16S rRNA (uracil(1498)-N(3))-methyltransferase [Pleionea sediminis]